MKKTLIALAVAASAAVSGIAMAGSWDASGSGGSVNLGGTLTVVQKSTPWEVKVGDAVTGLDAQIQKGQSNVNIILSKSIPVLGIRVADSVNKTFVGGTGLSPQINYSKTINTDNFKGGSVPLKMAVRDVNNQIIGSMTVDLTAYGESSWSAGNAGPGKKQLFASSAGSAFFGGLGKNNNAVSSSGLYERVVAIDKSFVANYKKQGSSGWSGEEKFAETGAQYSAFYGSGFEAGKVLSISLNEAAGDEHIEWKAALPIIVSYQ